MRFGSLDRSPRLSPRGLPGRCPVHDASTAPGREASVSLRENTEIRLSQKEFFGKENPAF